MDDQIVDLVIALDGGDPDRALRLAEQIASPDADDNRLAYGLVVQGLCYVQQNGPGQAAVSHFEKAARTAKQTNPRLSMLASYYQFVCMLMGFFPAEREQAGLVPAEALKTISDGLLQVFLMCRELGTEHDVRAGIAISLAAECELRLGERTKALSYVGDAETRLIDHEEESLVAQRLAFNRQLIDGAQDVVAVDYAPYLYTRGELLFN